MTRSSFLITCGLLFLHAFPAWATAESKPPWTLLRGSDQQPVVLSDVLSEVSPGSIILMGERHATLADQDQQLVLLNELRRLGRKVSVGMEFFPYPAQESLDRYRSGSLDEVRFLQLAQWGQGFSFDYYRDQVLFPLLTLGEMTWALNAPKWVTAQVAKSGLSSLNEEQRKVLPPQFALGRDSYRERFLKSIPHPLKPEQQANYFAAQSLWDDTMAWKASEAWQKHPDQILVIIVGEFHVQYGGGLPDRLKARIPAKVVTFSQILTEGLSSDEIQKELEVSPVEGPRADYLWLSSTSQ